MSRENEEGDEKEMGKTEEEEERGRAGLYGTGKGHGVKIYLGKRESSDIRQ